MEYLEEERAPFLRLKNDLRVEVRERRLLPSLSMSLEYRCFVNKDIYVNIVYMYRNIYKPTEKK